MRSPQRHSSTVNAADRTRCAALSRQTPARRAASAPELGCLPDTPRRTSGCFGISPRAKAPSRAVDLLGAVVTVILSRRVGVHGESTPVSTRHRVRPDILACLGPSGADAVVAGCGGRTVPSTAPPPGGCSPPVRQVCYSCCRKRIAPARLQHLFSCRSSLHTGAAAAERCAVQAQGVAPGRPPSAKIASP